MTVNLPYALSESLSRAAGRVMPALQAAAARTGMDFNALLRTAKVESGFDPTARAATSSASGLFQFIDSTWLNTLRKYGARHGISAGSRTEALALRDDPYVSSLMAAEHMAENRQFLERSLGRAAGTSDLYMAHFLGAGGALRFLRNLESQPSMAAADLLPAAARANRAIFFDKGAPRSLAEVHGLLARRLGLPADARPVGGTGVPLAGTPVPSPASLPAGLPPDIAARIAGIITQAGLAEGKTAETPAMQPIDPRHAAQIAYLALAELGA